MKKGLIVVLLLVSVSLLGVWKGGGGILWQIKSGNIEPAYPWTFTLKNPNSIYGNVAFKLKADTLKVLPSLGSIFFDLTQTTVLFGNGIFNIDHLEPATNDSTSSQIGSPSNPYGAGYFNILNTIGNTVLGDSLDTLIVNGYEKIHWADTSALPITNNRSAMTIEMDTTIASPTNTKVIGLNFTGSALNGNTDYWIYMNSSNYWRADGTIFGTYVYANNGMSEFDDNGQFLWKGWRWYIDNDNDDSLAIIVFHTEDSIKVDTTDHILEWTGAGIKGKKVEAKGVFQYGLGYMGTADTVIVGGVKYAPATGMAFIDTSEGDTLKVYLNGTWVVK